MRHIPITCEQREAMLRAVGVSTVDDLFADIPEPARLSRSLDLPSGLSELGLAVHLRGLADSNRPATSIVSFAGAGCYDHYVPSIVDHVVRRPEFFTAYTPYQPEVSQGTLQAIWEYQTMMCELTGMDVANASMYDGATAFVEAAMMACRLTRRESVICASSVHPEWQSTLATYAEAGTFRVGAFPASDAHAGTVLISTDGELAGHDLASVVDETTAAVLVQSPNFFGGLEELEQIAAVAHAAGALLVVATNPVLLGVTEPPAAYGADIVVAEGQPLGSAMSLGGPGLGVFACRSEHVRQMPGRVVGKTVDVDGNTAFVLTLSTREQHIRREKATSNICSNHALNALAAGVHLSALGAEGLAGMARACVAKAHYLHDRLLATGRFEPVFDSQFGYEFSLRYLGDAEAMHAEMLDRGFLAGVLASEVDVEWPIGSQLDGVVIFAVTEKRTREQIDAFVEEVAAL